MKPIEVGCLALIVKSGFPENLGMVVEVIDKYNKTHPRNIIAEEAETGIKVEIYGVLCKAGRYLVKPVNDGLIKRAYALAYADRSVRSLTVLLDEACFPETHLLRIDDTDLDVSKNSNEHLEMAH